MWTSAVLLGAVFGVGLFLLVRDLVPAPVDPRRAVQRLTGYRPYQRPVDTSRGGVYSRVGLRALVTLRGRPTPGTLVTQADLDLVDVPMHVLLGQKVLTALAGLLVGPVVGFLFSVGGFRLPLTVTVLGSLLLAVGLWFVPDLEVRTKATEARQDLARVSTTFLELLAIARTSGALSAQAMRSVAAISSHWAFRRLEAAIERANLTGVPPWDAVDDLARTVQVPELVDVADIMRLSGEEGAQVAGALRSSAATKRDTALATEQGRARKRSETQTIPQTLMIFAFLALIVAPALAAL